MDKAKVKIFTIIAIVFLSIFLWGLFYTSGFNFFWEDFTCYRLDKEMYPPVTKNQSNMLSSLVRIGVGYINNFFIPDRLFQISFSPGFTDRPYDYLNWELLSTIFGDKIQFYRMFKAMVFALNACFIFLIINRISRIFAFLGVAYYLTSAEVWLALLYSCDMAIYAQCAITASILIFMKLTERNRLNWLTIWFFYLPIMILSNFSVLTKYDGRYLAIILLLTILFFSTKQFLLHLSALTILLFLEIPVLGFMKKIFVDSNFAPINLVTHNPLPFSQSLKIMAKNYIFPLNALGWIPLVLLFAVILLHIYGILFRRSSLLSQPSQKSNALTRERVFLFALWFLATFTMVALARSFNYYDAYDIQLLDLSFFIPPFIILLSFYVFWVYRGLNNSYRRLLFKAALILLSIHVVFVSFIRLNKFRIGWGSYYCGWQNAEEYIDNVSENALALAVNVMVYKPFIFLHSKNRVLVSEPPIIPSPFCDLQYIEKKFEEGNYKDIFVLGRGKLEFSGSSNNVSLVGIKTFEGNCGSFYDYIVMKKGLLERLKRIFRPQMKNTYLYHFQWRHNDRLL